MAQLFFGLMSGVAKCEPAAIGDQIVGRNGRRYVVTVSDSNDDGAVYVCVALDNGADCVVLEREVVYISRHAKAA